MNFTYTNKSSLTNHPYIVAGFLSTLIWIVFSFTLNKKYFGNALISGLYFSLWYTIGWFIWNYINKETTNHLLIDNNDINDNVNRYNILIIASLLWFLYKYVIQKTSINKAINSTGLFIIFYIISEILFIIIK